MTPCLTVAEEKAGEQNDSDEWDDVPVQEASKNNIHSSQEKSPAPASEPEAAREPSLPAVKAEIDLSSDDDAAQAVDRATQANGQPKELQTRFSNKDALPKQSAADLQTSRKARAVQDDKSDALLQAAEGAERMQRVQDQAHAFNGGKEETPEGSKVDTSRESEPVQSNTSPFNAKKAQQTPIPRDTPSKKTSDQSKVQESKAGHGNKAKKKLDMSAAPQSSKQTKGKGKKQAAHQALNGGSRVSNGDDGAAAEIHKARLKTSGAEFSLPSPTDKQHSGSGHEAAETNAPASSDAGKSNAVKLGKAVQPNGGLRAFANPDELPQTKNEAPHVEPTGDMPKTSVASAQKKAQEAGKAIECGRSMEQLQDQAASPVGDEGRQPNELDMPAESGPPKHTVGPEKNAVMDPSESAEGRGRFGDVEETTEVQAPSEQGLHNPEPGASRQHPRPPDPTPDSFSQFAAAVDTATPMGSRATARPQPAAEATAAEPSQEPKNHQGLRPIPDSTMLDPDPEAGRGQNGASFARGGPLRGLRPIPDSSILEPGSPSEHTADQHVKCLMSLPSLSYQNLESIHDLIVGRGSNTTKFSF